MSWDPYLDLDSGVLRNRLGITDRAELARVEAALTAARIYDLQRSPLPGRYDLDHLRALHRHVFQDVYDWAGELRTVAISRGPRASMPPVLYCPPRDLERVATSIFTPLARADYLRGLQRAEFVDRLAELLAAIDMLHPFREGNGRCARALLAQLSRRAGYPIRWQLLAPERNIAASRAAHHGDVQPMRAMLDQLIPRSPAGRSAPSQHGATSELSDAHDHRPAVPRPRHRNSTGEDHRPGGPLGR